MKRSIKRDKYIQYFLFIIALIIIITAFYIALKPSEVEEFSNLIIKGASKENATLDDGLRFAEEYNPKLITTKAIYFDNILKTVDNTASNVKDSSIDFTNDVKDYSIDLTHDTQEKINGVISKAKFKTTTVQTYSKDKRFKILIIGNNLNHKELVSWCNEIKKEFNSLYPYSSISNQFTITCGSLPFTIKDVDNNYAAKALILTIAKIKKQELGYDFVFVLEKDNCRSFALPTFASLVCYEKGKTIRIFMHEFSHSFAGLADEYSSPDDINEINNVIKKLGLNIKINNQLDLFSYSGLINPPNCIKKPKKGCGSWFEGCALVSKNTCRPSQNSMMRDPTYEKFNDESIKRIIDVANGKKIVTDSGIIR